MGRLALRAGWNCPDLEFVAVNEPSGDTATLAILTEFDSVQGRWDVAGGCAGDGAHLTIGDRTLTRSTHTAPDAIPWQQLGVDLVLESSGRFRKTAALQAHLASGARRVLVSAPVSDGPPNLVLGVNDRGIDFAEEPILTAASCTTNCLAPVVKVVHETFGIERGLVTTIHDPTNTQSVVDRPDKDPRRARAAGINLIPTSTNSATAVTRVFPALEGKLDSVAVRAPVLNASITDCVFQLACDTSVAEVNGAFEAAATQGPLVGILGYETRPLVSSDYVGDPRSGIVDGLSTRVTDGRLVKVLAWYDNEWGYANRLVELAARIAAALGYGAT